MRTTSHRASVPTSALREQQQGLGAAATTGTAIAINRQRIPETSTFQARPTIRSAPPCGHFARLRISRVSLFGLSDIQKVGGLKRMQHSAE